MTPEQREDFIRENTAFLSPPLTPEIGLHLAHEAVSLWEKTEEELGELGLPPPFWAFAWAGGQALARYVLDDPKIVEGKRVIDLASGSGLVAIAAHIAGAQSVLAADIDEFAVTAIKMNARRNSTVIEVTSVDLLAKPATNTDVILVGDLFYEKTLAQRLFDWLADAQQRGIACLVGDPGRSYLPKEKLDKLAEYNVPVTRDLEDAEIKKSAVWRLVPPRLSC